MQYVLCTSLENSPQTNPIIGRIECKAGHGAGRPTKKMVPPTPIILIKSILKKNTFACISSWTIRGQILKALPVIGLHQRRIHCCSEFVIFLLSSWCCRSMKLPIGTALWQKCWVPLGRTRQWRPYGEELWTRRLPYFFIYYLAHCYPLWRLTVVQSTIYLDCERQ